MSCNHIISDSEIESIYKIDSTYSVEFKKNECRFDETSKFIHLYVEKDSNIILHKPIVWDFLEDSRLYSISNYGKVARFDQIEISSGYKEDGISKIFDERAYSVLKRNNFKEIQLSATRDGIVVWPRLFYKFQNPKDDDKIRQQFQIYLIKIHGLSMDDSIKKMSIIKSVDKIPISLSCPKDGKIYFSEWLMEKIKSNKVSLVSKMYKEVS